MLFYTKLLTVFLIQVSLSVAIAAGLPCNPEEPNQKLSSKTGAYVRADIWNVLPQAVDRLALNRYENRVQLASFYIEKDGRVNGHSAGWHEGFGSMCPIFRGKQIWAIFYDGNNKRVVEGSFLKVSDELSLEGPIFHHIFGTACYIDKQKREWCFDKQGIALDQRRLNFRLSLDSSESAVPGFEMTVSVAIDRSKNDYFLGFVRTTTGWTVYRMSRAAFDRSDRPVWSPDKMPKPWETLTRAK